jgi:hypothetical protein
MLFLATNTWAQESPKSAFNAPVRARSRYRPHSPFRLCHMLTKKLPGHHCSALIVPHAPTTLTLSLPLSTAFDLRRSLFFSPSWCHLHLQAHWNASQQGAFSCHPHEPLCSRRLDLNRELTSHRSELTRSHPALPVLCHTPFWEPEMKPPYVCPGCSNHTYSNNMVNWCHVQ